MVRDSVFPQGAHAPARELNGDGKVAFVNKIRTQGHTVPMLQQESARAGRLPYDGIQQVHP